MESIDNIVSLKVGNEARLFLGKSLQKNFLDIEYDFHEMELLAIAFRVRKNGHV